MLIDLIEEELDRRTHAVATAMQRVREAERVRAEAEATLLASHDEAIAILKDKVEEAKQERNRVAAKLRVAKKEAKAEAELNSV